MLPFLVLPVSSMYERREGQMCIIINIKSSKWRKSIKVEELRWTCVYLVNIIIYNNKYSYSCIIIYIGIIRKEKQEWTLITHCQG